MSRYRDERDDYRGIRRQRGRVPADPDFDERDYYPRPRRYEREPSGRNYEYDERDVPRGGRPWGLRGDYDAYAYGRGDHYRDEYYTGRRRDDDDRDASWGGWRREPREYEERERAYEGARRRGATRSHLRCRDIMTRDVTVALRDTTLDEVARKMRDEDTGIIPIVEPGAEASESVSEQHRVAVSAGANGKLVGLITDRDIVVRALAEGRDAREVRAEDVMTSDIHTALPNDRVIEVIRKMGDKQVRRIPVVDREGNLRGIISMADVALETGEDRELADALEEISSGHSFWNRIFG